MADNNIQLSSMDQEFLSYSNYLERQNASLPEAEKKKKERISINSFYIMSVIGKGAYATVSLVRKRDNNQVYALKAIKKSLISAKNQKDHVIAERNILKKVENQYIIKMKYAFQDDKKIYFVLEYCGGGELYSLLSSKRMLNEQQTKFYAAQMVKAIEYLHSYNIIYRDLKPENVLIDKDGYIKLTDFGLSKENADKNDAISLCGTPEYLSPEILLQKGHGKPVDWWTLGNIIWEMMTGYPPFYNENRKEMFQNIKENPPKPHVKIQGNLKNLLMGLLEKDPNKRLGTIGGASEIIDHPWFGDLRWEALESRSINPPFKPMLESDIDVRYIDQDFLDMSLSENGMSGQSNNSLFPFSPVDSYNNQSKFSPAANNEAQMDAENSSYEQVCRNDMVLE